MDDRALRGRTSFDFGTCLIKHVSRDTLSAQSSAASTCSPGGAAIVAWASWLLAVVPVERDLRRESAQAPTPA
ncbi:hypothetical protein OV079_32570 [Nannocystis pusilla]|uniref:Uncharacterized protein n=1 Tax=Nannocystis pusilla TaxID=889268 RepID=A0A9X3F2J7_9BACT|nr:hypothetical protein [Nannocystis pusilla]MCY1010221.1 hypothetical protein [Nannocystis pusilla]